jgi:hypothetical protein
MDDHEHRHGEMRIIDPEQGLHRLKRGYFQKTYMGAQCDALRGGIDRAIDVTLAAAPIRENPYPLARPLGRLVAGPEARWEQGLWEQWSPSTSAPALGAWHRLVSYQVMLRNTNDDAAWGEIDLLGTSLDGRPVVVELKAPGADDTPAEILIEAASYALALRNAWPRFGPQWCAEVEKLGLRADLTTPTTWPLICVAPNIYWDTWIGSAPKARKVSLEARAALGRLCDAFTDRGYPVTFVSLESAEQDTNEIPRRISTTIVDPTGSRP